MAVPLRTARAYDGGITDANDATTVLYVACTVEPVAPRAPTIVYCLMVIRTINSLDNVECIWRQEKYIVK